MIAKDGIEDLVKAIELASKDGLKSVEVSMSDLCILVEHMQDLQADCDFFENEVNNLKHKNRLLNISLAKCEMESLDRPVRLDYYA